MPRMLLSTGSVHYSIEGTGTPVVLLHALPGEGGDFGAVTPALAQNHQTIALDWPGSGQSDFPPPLASVGGEFYYETLREFLTALSLPPAFFIGNSIGGNAAARLASELPDKVRGLVLVAPGGFTAHHALTRCFCRLQSGRFSLPPKAFARLYLRRRTETVKAMLHRAETVQSLPERIALNRKVWQSFATPENDLRHSSRTIKAPTLLLFGKYDPVIPARTDGRAARDCFPAARFVEMPCGHAPFAEVPDLFLKEVEPFLARLSEGEERKPPSGKSPTFV